MSLYLGDKPIANDGLQRLTGEIGDIGIAPFGIDESLNLRRYLNGQVISQTQFEAFTNKVKSAIALYPNLAATEENWQAEVTNSKLGQCGKFVIDDEAGTIRLPKVVNINGLQDLTLIGGIKAESLPNITGTAAGNRTPYMWNVCSGALYNAPVTTPGANQYGAGADTGLENYSSTLGLNASLSSPTYQDGAPVQQEAVQYPYYIQVATGIEETLPAIREYKVNNSNFFGQSMWSDIEPNNASLLVSNGQWNSKSVYPDYYVWLVEQMNKGVDKFKGTTAYQFKGNTPETESYCPSFATRNPIVGSVIYGNSPIQALGYATQVNDDGSVVVQDVVNNINATLVFNQELPNLAWFTDYDFAINATDETFRLPLLNGEEDLPDYKNGLSIGSLPFTAKQKGTMSLKLTRPDLSAAVFVNGVDISSDGLPNQSGAALSTIFDVKKGDVITANQAINRCLFFPSIGNGTLYYYVGDVVQDASLINAGAVLNDITNLKTRVHITETYNNGTSWYRVYSDGWVEQGGIVVTGSSPYTVNLLKEMRDTSYHVLISSYGDSTNAQYWAAHCINKTTTSFQKNQYSNFFAPFEWEAKGYKS